MEEAEVSSGTSDSGQDAKTQDQEECEQEVHEQEVRDAMEDARLQRALRMVRQMPQAKLKEQCVVTEWVSMKSDAERDLLLDAIADPKFWDEVEQMTIGDLETQLEEDDDVDTESRLLEMFKCFDVDQSGTIDCNEMHQLLLYMGVSATAEDVKKLIQQVDSDEDGQIVQAEFMQVMKLAQAGELSIAAPTRQSIRRASIRITRDRPMLSL
jgi:hypothetical protein